MHIILALGITLIAALIAAITDLPVKFGAHPWWAQTVILIGAPIGMLLGSLLWAVRVRRAVRIAVGALGFAAAFAVAKYGQIGFANSYAEDQLAGKLWYFGWIAVPLGAALLLASAARSRSPKDAKDID
jgi:hypothetical protein